jgi:hypothetical protein
MIERRARTPWIVGGGVLAVAVAAIVAIVVVGADDEDEGIEATTTTITAGESAAEVSVEEIPAGAVAFVAEVPDGVVTEEDFELHLDRAAATMGLNEPPASDDPQYESIREQALSNAILPIWIEGEAAERGIAVTEAQVDRDLETIVETSFGDRKEFERFVTEQMFCTEAELEAAPPEECKGVRTQVELRLIAEQIEADAFGDVDPASPEAQDVAAEFARELTEKWRMRTACVEGYVIERCSNGPEPTFEEDEPLMPGPGPGVPN